MILSIRRMALASDGSKRYYESLVTIEARGYKLPDDLVAYGMRTCEEIEAKGTTVALFVNGQPECCSPFRSKR
jgi:hypothetical protein